MPQQHLGPKKPLLWLKPPKLLLLGKKLRVVFSFLRHFVSRQHFCKVTFLGFLKGGSVFDKNVGHRFLACDVGMYPQVLLKYC